MVEEEVEKDILHYHNLLQNLMQDLVYLFSSYMSYVVVHLISVNLAFTISLYKFCIAIVISHAN